MKRRDFQLLVVAFLFSNCTSAPTLPPPNPVLVKPDLIDSALPNSPSNLLPVHAPGEPVVSASESHGSELSTLPLGAGGARSASYLLQIKFEKDRHDHYQYFTQSVETVSPFESTSLATESKTQLEFSLKKIPVQVDHDRHSIIFSETVVERNGSGDLYLFGFPEKDEEFDREYLTYGDIIAAGTYPKDSMFRVPMIVMSDKPVKAGAKWGFYKNWKSKGAEFKVSAHFELMQFVACFNSESCAVVAVKAIVEPVGDLSSSSAVTNPLHARYEGVFVWAVHPGLLAGGVFRFKQSISNAKQQTIENSTCMVVGLKESRGAREYLTKFPAQCEARSRASLSLNGFRF